MIAAWWFAPAPATRLAALRIAIGAYATIWLIGRSVELVALVRSSAASFAPVGVVRVLHAPLPLAIVIAIAALAIAALVAFTVGWRYRITAPIAALGLLWTLSYRNAWGMVFHTENLLVLHVLALAVAPAADAWAVDNTALPFGSAASPGQAGLVGAHNHRARPAGHGWPIRLLIALTVATYLLAGIAKLRLAGALWLDGEQLRNQIAVDNLRKALVGGATAPLGGWIVAHPRLLAALSIATLVLELGAPLALLIPRLRLPWAAAVWAFHLGVILTMNVWFIYPLSGVAFLPLIEAERVVGVLRDRLGMRRAAPR